MISNIRRFSALSITLVMLVILAGSIVRTTGSGMGCPDWPNCFGRTIPPTSTEEVTWGPGKAFNSGYMIIRDEVLYTAKASFTTGDTFDPSNWEVYEKHDYAIFNPTHTWIEFLNRLLAPITGVPIVLLFLTSVIHFFRTRQTGFMVTSGAVLLVLGGVAFLGKLVVDGNLIPAQISLHMFGSLMLLGLLLLIRRKSTRSNYARSPQGWHQALLLVALLLTVVQIFMGTQVRESVDFLGETGVPRADWVASLPVIFKIHRSFSILIILINVLLAWQSLKHNLGWSLQLFVVGILGLEVIAGIVMAYADMPRFFQPVHLVFAIGLAGIQLYQWFMVSTKPWVERRQSMIA